jgi:hypothetical protein
MTSKYSRHTDWNWHQFLVLARNYRAHVSTKKLQQEIAMNFLYSRNSNIISWLHKKLKGEMTAKKLRQEIKFYGWPQEQSDFGSRT